MIIESIVSGQRNIFWTLFHIGLGFACTLTPVVLIFWFYFVFISNFSKSLYLLHNRKPILFLNLFSYLISYEVLDRMAKTSPYIPYELGKYLLVLMGVLGIAFMGVRSQIGLIMVLLITPALFYDLSGQRDFGDLVFSYLAPLAIGFGIAFSDRLVLTKIQFHEILKVIWLGTLACLVFTFIRTPDFENLEFQLRANFQTTGGHASNQVSTILGLGAFLSFYNLFKRLYFSGYLILDIIIFCGFIFQGLISFSRGGMIVSGVAILTVLFIHEGTFLKSRISNRNKTYVIFIIMLIMFGVFRFANSLTSGNLLLRYKGETMGTLSGTKDITVDHLLTGRLRIFEGDVNLWFDHLIFGVGCGSSRYLRNFERYIPPHIELSRLLAEHGLLGLMYAILFFIIIPLKCWRLNKGSNFRVILFSLILIAGLTTFHAGMRTFTTPLLMILGSLKIIDVVGVMKLEDIRKS